MTFFYPLRDVFLFNYVGEVIAEKEKETRLKNGQGNYIMQYGWKMFIDSRQYGNLSRFINHSCEANCKSEKVKINKNGLL